MSGPAHPVDEGDDRRPLWEGDDSPVGEGGRPMPSIRRVGRRRVESAPTHPTATSENESPLDPAGGPSSRPGAAGGADRAVGTDLDEHDRWLLAQRPPHWRD